MVARSPGARACPQLEAVNCGPVGDWRDGSRRIGFLGGFHRKSSNPLIAMTTGWNTAGMAGPTRWRSAFLPPPDKAAARTGRHSLHLARGAAERDPGPASS